MTRDALHLLGSCGRLGSGGRRRSGGGTRSRTVVIFATALLLAAVAGCSDDSGGAADSGPDVGGDSGICPAGSAGCPCASGDVCIIGTKCNGGVCEPCTDGTLGCVCGTKDDCNPGELCVSEVCTACAAGSEGCACTAEGQCDDGLTCADDVCVAPSCPPGTLGCACDEGACSDGICDPLGGRCREPLSCADIDCLSPRVCSTSGGDAVCLQGECETGYVWNPFIRDCEAASCANTNCVDVNRICEEGASGPECTDCRLGYSLQGTACVQDATTCGTGPTSLSVLCPQTYNRVCTGGACAACLPGYAEHPLTGECSEGTSCADLSCADQHRACVSGFLAYCDTCLPGYVEEAGSCRPVITKDQLSCGAGEFAVPETPSRDAYCMLAPCPEGKAAMPDGSCENAVFLCPPSCTGEGQTGRIWPYRISLGLSTGVCFCETAEGYYYDLDKREAAACDADGDGWLNVSARAALHSVDPAVKANARCQPQQIDRVRLINEHGQHQDVVYCSAEPALRGPFDAACFIPQPVPLFEANTHDSEALFASSTGPGIYGTGSRALMAKEVNSLTKACSSRTADFNGNSIADVTEWPGAPLPFTNPNKAAALSPFQPFTNFLELHTNRFMSVSTSPVGRLEIAERSRCSGEVPVVYGASADGYATECTRRRSVRFDSQASIGESQIGLDLARFACDQSAGSCPVPPAVVGDGQLTSGDLGLCAPQQPLPDDWRGMTHHSQYQCIVATTAVVQSDPSAPYLHNVSKLAQADATGTGAAWQLNACQAGPYSAGLPGQTDDVALSCTTVDPTSITSEQVGFAALLYQPYVKQSAYVAGCINECSEWGEVCPGFGVTGGCVSPADAFGQIECNDCPQSGQPCVVPNTYGPCANGVYVCNAQGQEVCQQLIFPSPESLDAPGTVGVDDNCDGFVDGAISEAVFVDGATGIDSTAHGMSPAQPVKTIELGLYLATTSSRKLVLVAQGSYSAHGRATANTKATGAFLFQGYVNVNPAGPAVYQLYHGPYTLRGGYSRSCDPGELWCYTGGAVTISTTHTKAAIQKGSLGGPITVSGISFSGGPGNLSHRSAYGLFVANAGSHPLRFESCSFQAGAGLAGGDGASHANAAPNGGDGKPGKPGCEDAGGACAKCAQPTGGAGGTGTVCADGSLPPAGGAGGYAEKGTTMGGPGSSGEISPSLVAGGAGGAGVLADQCENNVCVYTFNPYSPPSGGAVCNYQGKSPTGSGQAPARGAVSCTTFTSNGQVDTKGAPGASGAPGAGGGGGGGGGGGDHSCDSYGGSGGGGGSGGCGGKGGDGGHSGGGSYAAYIYDSQVELVGCSLTAGVGGDGGEGGPGQPGGKGGQGGRYFGELFGGVFATLAADLKKQCKSQMYGGPGEQDDASHGAMGGDGGDGQAGAVGGPGAGGPSIAVMSAHGAVVTVASDCTLSVSNTPSQSGVTDAAGTTLPAPAQDQATESTFAGCGP